MKNHNISRNKILIFLALLFLLVFCCRVYLKNQLNKTYSHSSGKIIKLNSGGPSGSIHFKFKENEKSKLNNTMTITWQSCRSIIRQEMKTLQQLEFPVVYSKNNFDNAEILFFEDQYEKFEIEIPSEIREIVRTLSSCKD